MSSGEKYLIVNADDFGLSEGVNRGIIHAHRKGIVTSTTLLTHMPASLSAVELAKSNPSLGVGVHLNYTQGRNLYPRLIASELFSSNGSTQYPVPMLWVATVLNRRIRRRLRDLFCYQITWCLERGVEITHLDTHKHIHICPWIAQVVAQVAREFDIPAVRFPYEFPVSPGALVLPNRAFFFLFFPFAKVTKEILRKRGIVTPDQFYGIYNTGKWSKERFLECIGNLPAGVTEVMVHPGYHEGLRPGDTRLLGSRRRELEMLIDKDILNCFRDFDIKRISYTFFRSKKT